MSKYNSQVTSLRNIENGHTNSDKLGCFKYLKIKFKFHYFTAIANGTSLINGL